MLDRTPEQLARSIRPRRELQLIVDSGSIAQTLECFSGQKMDARSRDMQLLTINPRRDRLSRSNGYQNGDGRRK
jgi:hypothetical protein